MYLTPLSSRFTTEPLSPTHEGVQQTDPRAGPMVGWWLIKLWSASPLRLGLGRAEQREVFAGSTMAAHVDSTAFAGASSAALKKVHLQRLVAFAVALVVCTLVVWQLAIVCWAITPFTCARDSGILRDILSILVGAIERLIINVRFGGLTGRGLIYLRTCIHVSSTLSARRSETNAMMMAALCCSHTYVNGQLLFFHTTEQSVLLYIP